MTTNINIQTDGQGDTFVTGFNKYMTTSDTTKDHLNQLIENYERCFGQEPSAEDLNNALKFTEMFLAEVGECYPRSNHAEAASRLSRLIGNDAVETVENISNIGTIYKRKTTPEEIAEKAIKEMHLYK